MRPRILIIDPLEDLTIALAYLMRGRNWEVETARSLLEALRKIDAFHPQVVLAGVETPLEVGVAFATRVRELHDGSVVLAAMSAWPPSDVKEASPDLFDLVCHKPLTDPAMQRIEQEARLRFPSLEWDGTRDGQSG